MTLPLGWWTDLAVLARRGATIDEHAGHLVVRSPSSPLYHWGNFVMVTDPASVDDAPRWLARFEEVLPDSGHRAIGLIAEPRDPAGWVKAGLVVEHSDVLERRAAPGLSTVPSGYTVRPLGTGGDWECSTRLRITAEGDQAAFAAEETVARKSMVEAGDTAWFGAFAGDELAAELGIVDCGPSPEGRLARYQSVLTAPGHRRRGLTTHLLEVAAGWAEERGCRRWVILADDGTDANRLYRARGFAPADRAVQVYRPPTPAS